MFLDWEPRRSALHSLWQMDPRRDGVWLGKNLVMLSSVTTYDPFLRWLLHIFYSKFIVFIIFITKACLFNVETWSQIELLWKWFSLHCEQRRLFTFKINPVIFWCNPVPDWVCPKGVILWPETVACHLLTCLACDEWVRAWIVRLVLDGVGTTETKTKYRSAWIVR